MREWQRQWLLGLVTVLRQWLLSLVTVLRQWLLGLVTVLRQWLLGLVTVLRQWLLGLGTGLRRWLPGLALSFWQWLRDPRVLTGSLIGLFAILVGPPLWAWLHDATSGQATFLGSSLGLLAILAGALFNAYLNRRRDDQLRQEDRKALTAALLAELGDFRASLQSTIDVLKKGEKEGAISYPPPIRILPDLVPKVGLLDVDTVRKVMHAYNVAETIGEFFRRVPKESRPLELGRQKVDVIIKTLEWSVGIQDRAILALGGRPGGEDSVPPPQEWWHFDITPPEQR